MSSPKKKSGKGVEDLLPKQPWTFDASIMVCIESGIDGHRVFADRNCVATCRRLADLIPPLIPPPPPPMDPKEAKKLAAASQKSGPNNSSTKKSGGDENGANSGLLGGDQNVNRGPSSVSPLFEEDVGGEHPSTSGQLFLSRVDEDIVRRGKLEGVVNADKQQQQEVSENENENNNNSGNVVSTTPAIPLIRIECLNGRQIEAAIRISYYKYLGDHISDAEKRKTLALNQLGVTPEELLAIGTILGC